MSNDNAPLEDDMAGQVDQALRETGFGEDMLQRLSVLGRAISEQAPDLVAALQREAALANAEAEFYLPLGLRAMSEPQRRLLAGLLRGRMTGAELRHQVVLWARNLNLYDPAEAVRLDCARLAELLRAGVTRVFGLDPVRCDELLEAVERLVFAQTALVTKLARRGAPGPSTLVALPGEYTDFLERLHAELDTHCASGRSLAVMIVNCGVIERIDSAWGFQAGDLVRAKIIQRLKSALLRPGDSLVDLSRDELICLLPTVAGSGVALLAAQKILRVLGAPILIGESEIRARPGIGIALAPEHGDAPARLLQRAKVASRSALDRPERITVFEEDLKNSEADAFAYESLLRAAIEQSTLEVAYQPQFCVRTRRVLAAETLLRWDDPRLGTVPPQKAISIAESAGLVNQVAWWVLNTTLRHCTEFRSRGIDIAVSVNLSPYNLREADLPEFIDRGLRTWDVQADRLVIEITETAVLGAPAEIVDTLKRIKDLGVRLSIDDFGTGYASLSYLSEIPLDELKIDRTFVTDMLVNPRHDRITRALVGLGHQFGMVVVAEGVEDDAVAERLRELGCDRMQGYRPGRPLGAAEFAARYAPA